MKQCPKCGGQMSLEQDPEYNDWEWHCLQCGNVIPRSEPEGLQYRGGQYLKHNGYFNENTGAKLPVVGRQ